MAGCHPKAKLLGIAGHVPLYYLLAIKIASDTDLDLELDLDKDVDLDLNSDEEKTSEN